MYRKTRFFCIGLFFLLVSSVLQAQTTYTVNSADDTDDGACNTAHCSLREAILAANADSGPSVIAFNLPGAAPFLIRPVTLLPDWQEAATTLDATTQPSFMPGDVVLDGSLLPAGENDGLVIAADNSAVFGLTVRNFSGDAIEIRGASGVQIGTTDSNRGNRILSSGAAGIRLTAATSGCRISGNALFCNAAGITLEAGANGDMAAPAGICAFPDEITGTALPGSEVEVFSHGDTTCAGAPCQGNIFLGTATADAAGSWSLSGPFALGQSITATATDPNGNTSAFASCAVVQDRPIASADNTGPYCTGSTVSIELVGSSNLGQPPVYQWTGPNGYTSNVQNPSDATEAGVYYLVVLINGCASELDSTVVEISDAVRITIGDDPDEWLCPSDSLVINGTVYNQANPSGNEMLPGANGACDTLIDVRLSFFPPATGQLDTILCDGGLLEIDGEIFDAANPDGTVRLKSFDGCDSLLTVSLQFYPPAVDTLDLEFCAGDSVLVNGVIYDVNRPSGVEVLAGAAAGGCDSTVVVALSFLQPGTYDLEQTLCAGQSVVVNGTTYDENNPSGRSILAGASANGCDSIVNIMLTFTSQVEYDLDTFLCAGESLVVNGTVYSAFNPSGTEVLSGAAAGGCDSVIHVRLNFYPPSVGELSLELCPGETVEVNGTEYGESNPTGTEIIAGGSVNGCDSVININLRFVPMAVWVSSQSPLCPGDSNGSISIDSIRGGLEPYSYTLNERPAEPVGALPVSLTGLVSGEYRLTVVDAAGCTLEQTITLESGADLQIGLEEEVTIRLGDSILLEPVFSFTPAEVRWSPAEGLSCSDCLAPYARPGRTTTFKVEVADSLGCIVSAAVQIMVDETLAIFAPNAFSPNNDGRNDFFTLFSDGDAIRQIASLRIFDRWGGLVFEAFNLFPNNESIGWDGSARGQTAPMGTYVYFAELELLDGKTVVLSGEVNLVK